MMKPDTCNFGARATIVSVCVQMVKKDLPIKWRLKLDKYLYFSITVSFKYASQQLSHQLKTSVRKRCFRRKLLQSLLECYRWLPQIPVLPVRLRFICSCSCV